MLAVRMYSYGEQGLHVWECKTVWGLATDDPGRSAGLDAPLSFPSYSSHTLGRPVYTSGLPAYLISNTAFLVKATAVSQQNRYCHFPTGPLTRTQVHLDHS